MANTKPKLRTSRIPPGKIVEECLRNYTQFRALFNDTSADPDQPHKQCIIEHSYAVHNEDGSIREKITIVLSVWDLFTGVNALSKRKKEAIWYIAILGHTQEEVSKIMNCRAVTCGQYLKAGCTQLAKEIYSEEIDEISNV